MVKLIDARKLSPAAADALWRELGAAEAGRQAERQAARATPGFDAMKATSAEVAAECRRRGW